MRNIKLLALELEGFRSFRTRTLIEFSQGSGLKFISGDNKLEPRLGANGAGKSTIWDALSYCISGKSVKGMRASDLMSWGAKEIKVLSAWDIDGEIAIIERLGNPDRLLLNDQPVDQSPIDRLLGLARARFLQSAIFGQAVPLFIDLSGPDRGVLLDEVLDLGIWLKAADQASKRFTEHGKAMDAAAKDIAFYTGKLEGLEAPEAIQAEIDAWRGIQENEIKLAIDALETQEAALEALKPALRATRKAVELLPDISAINNQIQIHLEAKAEKEANLRSFDNSVKTNKTMLDFYQHTEVCGSCNQKITKEHAESCIKTLSGLIKDLESKIAGTEAIHANYRGVLAKLKTDLEAATEGRDAVIEKRAKAAAAFNHQKQVIDNATAAIEAMAEETNPHQARYDRLIAFREAALQKLKQANGIRRINQAGMLRADFWRTGFKRVRLFMVKRILLQLEIETAAAAHALGLIGWKVNFTTELETKSGSLRPGIHITVASPTAVAPWEAWSGGEGQRIRLAVALGLASLIQRMAGVVYNFEVYDEPTAFLAPEGIEDLLACLHNRAQTLGKSIWVCDHRVLMHSHFEEIWQVKKTGEGSAVHLLSNLAE